MKETRRVAITSWIAILIFLLSACSVPVYSETSQPTLSTGSINGWVWHDSCASGLDGQSALSEAWEVSRCQMH